MVRLGGFINSAPGFADGPKVMNGASDLMVTAFGDKGRHARTTIGVSRCRSMPLSRSRARSKCQLGRWTYHAGLADRATGRTSRACTTPPNGVIENTPSAFEAAIAGNYAIECDLQISADGEAMVHHDDALGRLTDGTGRLDAMPAAELKRVAFKATKDRMLDARRAMRAGGGRAPRW